MAGIPARTLLLASAVLLLLSLAMIWLVIWLRSDDRTAPGASHHATPPQAPGSRLLCREFLDPGAKAGNHRLPGG